MSSTILPWHRFWCRLGDRINCGDDGLGFLSDPEGALGELANPSVSNLKALLPESGPIVLCGEPGIGKTTEVQNLRAVLPSSERSIWIAFRGIADTVDFRRRTAESTGWQEWRSGSGRLTLVVDGVDEGLLRVPNFLNDLAAILRDEPATRLRLVLVCRTAEWPIETGANLIALWPPTERPPIYELCPLRRVDVELAAQARKCDAEEFLNVVWERSVVGLAARPVTLFFLLTEYSRHGGLPASHRELYERGTSGLIREVDPVRLETLRKIRGTAPLVSHAERLRAAQRMAALVLLCGRSAVRRSAGLFESETGQDLPIEAAESSQPPSVSMAALEEAIESALFTSVGERRFSFAHQTFAECLAAQDVRHLEVVQLRRLLCRRDARGEHVVPQLAELAAWVAGVHSAFCEHLLGLEPEVLLRSDVTRLQGALKARLVTAILTWAHEERIFDRAGFGRFLSGLKHPGLGAQLLTWISNPAAHLIARRIAFNIAGKCGVVELIEPLLAVVSNGEETQAARERAFDTLEEIVPDAQLALFEPFARGEIAGDPDDAFKGDALRRLVPKRWKVKEALPYLTPRKNERLMGSYALFLSYDLPRAVEDGDIPAVLIWLRPAGNLGRARSVGHKVGETAFVRALSLLHVPAVAREATETWHAWIKCYELHQLPTDSQIRKALTENERIRRHLATLILNYPATNPDDLSCLTRPIALISGEESLAWLLDEIPTVPLDRRRSWVAAIAWLTRDPLVQAACWDELLARIAEIPELAEEFALLRPWALDEPIARERKAQWLQDEQQRAEFETLTRQRQAFDPGAGIAAAFAAYAKGDDQAWIQLWNYLILEKGGHQNWMTCDVTECENWNLLSSEQRSLVPPIARAFLFSALRELDHRIQLTEVELAAACAIWLLRDAIAGDAAMRAVVLGPWIPVLALHLDPDPAPRRALFVLGYRLDAAAMRTELLTQASRDTKKHRHPFAFRIARDCWDAALSQIAIQLLTASADPRLVVNALNELVQLDRDAALQYAEATIARMVPGASSYPIHLFGALIVGLVHGAARIWPTAEPLLGADDQLATAVLSHVCTHFNLEQRKVLDQLPESVLAGFCLLLHRRFPRESDPPRDSSQVDTPRMLRNRIPGFIAGRGTEAACLELQKLVTALPTERTWLRWTLHEAVNNLRRTAWVRSSTDDVKVLLERRGVRLLSSEDDLLELVIESLGRLQRRLTGQANPSVEDMWTWDGGGLKRSNFRPKDEESLSDYVARWLEDDVGPKAGVVTNREVQPRRGARTDITIEAVIPVSDSEFDRLTVVIEVKGCWHSAVRTGLKSQLVTGYLEPHQWRCGLYLVGWFVCPQWTNADNRLKSATSAEAAIELAELAREFDGVNSSYRVDTILLDCALPLNKSPSS